MKLWVKLTLIFTGAQLVATAAIGISVTMVVRETVREMVARESRVMVSSISDAIELASDSIGTESDRVPAAVRSFVLARSIGETGFYFVLNSRGDYLVHPKPDVEGQNWAGEEPFIDYILANRNADERARFVRYVSPKTGEWKHVYFTSVPGTDLIICSSAWEHEMYAPISVITSAVVLILLAALALTTVLTVYASLRIGRPLGNIVAALQELGNGNLTASVPEDSWTRETAAASRALNDAVIRNMSEAVRRIKQSTVQGSQVKEELSASTIQTSSALNEIVANIGSIRDRIAYLDQTIDRNCESVDSISIGIQAVDAQIADQTAMVEESRASINEMNSVVTSVSSITTKRREASERLSQNSREASEGLRQANEVFAEGVVAKIDSIREAADALEDIAAQTNLLAMNAAIEAAHAGSAGQGFAVVADEIRKLATEAGLSSSSISKTLKTVIGGIERTKSAIGQATEEFTRVVSETVNTAEALEEIQRYVTHLESGGGEIMTATEHLQETTHSIRENSRAISSQAATILQSENEIRDISSEASSGIAEMSLGVGEINGAMELLTGLTSRLSAIINELEEGVAQFRTDAQVGDDGVGVAAQPGEHVLPSGDLSVAVGLTS